MRVKQTLACVVSFSLEQIDVKINTEHHRRFGPEGDVDQVILLCHGGRARLERVRDQAVHRGIRPPNYLVHDDFDMSPEDVHMSLQVLVQVLHTVVLDGQAVIDGLVTYVKPCLPSSSEDVTVKDIAVVAINRAGRLDELEMSVAEVDKGDGEASRRKIDCEVDGRLDVTLQCDREEDGMELSASALVVHGVSFGGLMVGGKE